MNDSRVDGDIAQDTSREPSQSCLFLALSYETSATFRKW